MTEPSPLSTDLLRGAKWAFSTRRVARGVCSHMSDAVEDARSGDLVLGRVESLGSHKRIQLPAGRPSQLYVGDFVVAVCGDRYAPDQFEGVASLSRDPADFLAAGGVIGRMRSSHGQMALPTKITPLGILARGDGRPVNLADHALLPVTTTPSEPIAIAVVGAAMNAGKTVTGSSLVHGLVRAGRRVAAVKATGTAAYNDYNAYVDAGPIAVSDFTDAGMVSTYRQPIERVEDGLDLLLNHAAGAADVVVVEFADGILQAETAALLRSPHVRRRLAGCLLAVPDALSAAGGVAALRKIGLEPAAVTGTVSCSPLAAAEAQNATGLRVLTRGDLMDPARANALLAEIAADQWRPAPLGSNVEEAAA